MKAVSKTIREAIARWPSYSALARASGVDLAVVSRLARGESDARLSTIDKLVPVLKLELRSKRRLKKRRGSV